MINTCPTHLLTQSTSHNKHAYKHYPFYITNHHFFQLARSKHHQNILRIFFSTVMLLTFQPIQVQIPSNLDFIACNQVVLQQQPTLVYTTDYSKNTVGGSQTKSGHLRSRRCRIKTFSIKEPRSLAIAPTLKYTRLNYYEKPCF